VLRSCQCVWNDFGGLTGNRDASPAQVVDEVGHTGNAVELKRLVHRGVDDVTARTIGWWPDRFHWQSASDPSGVL
jgi:hypothetical protein